MAWTILKQQQQRGAQIPNPGKAPAEAVKGRAAQDHEQAAGAPQADESPASRLEHREGDNTPSAPDDEDKRIEWDEVVQPERQQHQGRAKRDDLPLPEGK